jgi:hypothetical protein
MVVKYLIEEHGADIHIDNNVLLQISADNNYVELAKYLDKLCKR